VTMDRQILITVTCDSQIKVDRLEEKKFLVLDRARAMLLLLALERTCEHEGDAYSDFAKEIEDFIERSWA